MSWLGFIAFILIGPVADHILKSKTGMGFLEWAEDWIKSIRKQARNE